MVFAVWQGSGIRVHDVFVGPSEYVVLGLPRFAADHLVVVCVREADLEDVSGTSIQ